MLKFILCFLFIYSIYLFFSCNPPKEPIQPELMSHPLGGRPLFGGVPANSPPGRTPGRTQDNQSSRRTPIRMRQPSNGEGPPPPLMLATPPEWRPAPSLGALPLNSGCDMSSYTGIRPPRPHPVGARPVPASSINSIAPLPPPGAPLNPLQGAFTNGRRRRCSSISPPSQYSVNLKKSKQKNIFFKPRRRLKRGLKKLIFLLSVVFSR